MLLSIHPAGKKFNNAGTRVQLSSISPSMQSHYPRRVKIYMQPLLEQLCSTLLQTSITIQIIPFDPFLLLADQDADQGQPSSLWCKYCSTVAVQQTSLLIYRRNNL
jgi:hypothetical protein